MNQENETCSMRSISGLIALQKLTVLMHINFYPDISLLHYSWNAFRSYCAHDRKLKIALEIPTELPSDEEIDRWLGEPIGCAILKCKSFLTNPGGYPVLSKSHQDLVTNLLRRKINIVITGASREETRPFYHQYILHLWKVRRLI